MSEPTAEEIWRTVELARHKDRPHTLDYVELLFDDFIELHGDRASMDDLALVAGLGRFDGQTVALVGHQKGRAAKEMALRRFGMASPEGYRKAIRVMELAERHGFPVALPHRHAGRVPGRPGRAARPGRLDRPLAARDAAARDRRPSRA